MFFDYCILHHKCTLECSTGQNGLLKVSSQWEAGETVRSEVLCFDKACREVELVENFYFSWHCEHASFWESQFSKTAERGLHQDHTQTPSARSSLLSVGLSGSSWDADSCYSASRRVLRHLTVYTDTWVEPGLCAAACLKNPEVRLWILCICPFKKSLQ